MSKSTAYGHCRLVSWETPSTKQRGECALFKDTAELLYKNQRINGKTEYTTIDDHF